MTAAVGRLSWIVVDSADPERLAHFWSALLDVPVTDKEEGAYADLAATTRGGPAISFVRVPEAKAGKNRLHLDLEVANLAAASDRAVSFGASVVREVAGEKSTWRVLHDPEGNEFCLVQA